MENDGQLASLLEVCCHDTQTSGPYPLFAQWCETPLASSGHPANSSPMTIPADAPRDILRHHPDLMRQYHDPQRHLYVARAAMAAVKPTPLLNI
jgi:hypothetical protein